jgi:hypothetical protein
MRITWWLHPGIHETARMRLDHNNSPVLVHDHTAPEPALPDYDHQLAGPTSPPSAFVLL